MTTIVYRDGVLAADSVVGSSGWRMGHCNKIAVRDDGAAMGVSGEWAVSVAAQRWFLSGCQGDAPAGDYKAIVADADGASLLEDGVIGVPCTFLVPGALAIGCGWPAALAAMLMGADAVKAVEIACMLDPNSGGEITHVVVSE